MTVQEANSRQPSRLRPILALPTISRLPRRPRRLTESLQRPHRAVRARGPVLRWLLELNTRRCTGVPCPQSRGSPKMLLPPQRPNYQSAPQRDRVWAEPQGCETLLEDLDAPPPEGANTGQTP